MTQRQQVLKQISCPPECGFQVRSHDEAEVIDLTMRHASQKHPAMKVTQAQLKGMVKNA
jgi:predicted small metal-binding protein